jgi:hypothetical protein
MAVADVSIYRALSVDGGIEVVGGGKSSVAKVRNGESPRMQRRRFARDPGAFTNDRDWGSVCSRWGRKDASFSWGDRYFPT